MIPRNILDQVRALLRPLQVRIANTVARAVVQLVDDSTKQQLVQLGVLEGEDIDDGEHFHPYGLYSVPLPGAEAVVLFPNGDRGHPLVVAVSDRRHRPTGGQSGETGLYGMTAGARVRVMPNGDIEVQPAPGREVFIRSDGGSADRLVKRSEFNSHTHAVATTGTASAQTGTAAAPTPITGTSRLQAE
jgi:phage baseplate assembly protein V